MPGYAVADLIDVALTEVWHYGRSSTQIPERLGAMLADLHEVARPEHRPAVTAWCDAVGARARAAS